VEKTARDPGAAASFELVSPLADDLNVLLRFRSAKNPSDDQGLSPGMLPGPRAPVN